MSNIAGGGGGGSGENEASTLEPAKKRPEDFIFGKMVGEGSFSSVSDNYSELLNYNMLKFE